MCHVVTFADDGGGDSADATHWEDLVDMVDVRDWDFFQWGGGAVEDDVVVVYLDCVALGVRPFGGAGLRRFKLEEPLHVFETVG